MFDFKNQVVIVTGGLRGIGRGISESFLKAGATVIATYCSNHEKTEEFNKVNTAFNGHIDPQKFEISNYSQVEHFYTNSMKNIMPLMYSSIMPAYVETPF